VDGGSTMLKIHKSDAIFVSLKSDGQTKNKELQDRWTASSPLACPGIGCFWQAGLF